MSEQEIYGWGKPDGARDFHFFIDDVGDRVLLESVCSIFYKYSTWFWDPAEPLDEKRDVHDDENCPGCQAWLSVPSNGRARGASA
jgi:hypothetical protein